MQIFSPRRFIRSSVIAVTLVRRATRDARPAARGVGAAARIADELRAAMLLRSASMLACKCANLLARALSLTQPL